LTRIDEIPKMQVNDYLFSDMKQSRQPTRIRQHQIVDVARKIAATRGIEDLTVREIARGVGISEGDIYRHFKSKKDILLLLMDDIENTLLETVEEAASRQTKALDKLREVLVAHLSYVEQRNGVSFIVIAEALRLSDRDLRRKMLEVVERYLAHIKEILTQAVEKEEIEADIDIDTAATMFFAMVQTTVTLWSASEHAFSLTERYPLLWQSYMRNMAKR